MRLNDTTALTSAATEARRQLDEHFGVVMVPRKYGMALGISTKLPTWTHLTYDTGYAIDADGAPRPLTEAESEVHAVYLQCSFEQIKETP